MRGSLTGNYVRKTGDTMTGDLVISKPSPSLTLNASDGASSQSLRYKLGGVEEFVLTGGSTGANFFLVDGVAPANRIIINRIDGKMALGLVPLARMLVQEVTAVNGALVTVTTPVTTIVDSASLNVSTDDRLLIGAYVLGTKGATAGLNRFDVVKTAGTATIATYSNKTLISRRWLGDANDSVLIDLFGIIQVTAGGTLTLRLQGESQGSTMAVNAGDGQLYILNLLGA